MIYKNKFYSKIYNKNYLHIYYLLINLMNHLHSALQNSRYINKNERSVII